MADVVKAPKQRLVALRVGEVSLVDRPANEEEFLVIKNLEDNMADVENVAANQPDNPEAGAAPTETDAVDIEKAAEALMILLQKAAKPAEKDKKAKGTPAPGEKPPTDEELLAQRKAMLPPPLMAQMKKIIDMLQSMMGGGAPEQKTKKALDDGEPANVRTLVQVTEDGQVIIKAGSKQFTDGRMSMLKEALTPLLGLMKEVDPEGFGAMMGGMLDSSGVAPKIAPAVGLHSMPSGVAKSLEDIQKTLGTVAESVASVSKRIDTVEQAAAVSKGLPQNGNDNTQPKKSVWAGIL